MRKSVCTQAYDIVFLFCWTTKRDEDVHTMHILTDWEVGGANVTFTFFLPYVSLSYVEKQPWTRK